MPATNFIKVVRALIAMNQTKKLSTEWKRLKEEAIAELKSDDQWIQFSTSYLYRKNDFTGVGNFQIMDIPLKKTGLLSRYQGKSIFIVCVGTGPRDIRVYLAREINEDQIPEVLNN